MFNRYMDNKKLKKKKAEFGNFPPPQECGLCDGRGEIKDDYVVGGIFSQGSYWTYKKCLSCNGTGKNLWYCLVCESLLNNKCGMWCSNQNCKNFNLKVSLCKKKDE